MVYIQRGGGQYFPESECIHHQPIHNTQQFTQEKEKGTFKNVEAKKAS